jgi:hypothetical protein
VNNNPRHDTTECEDRSPDIFWAGNRAPFIFFGYVSTKEPVAQLGSPDPTHNFERNYSRSRLDSVGHKVSKHHFNVVFLGWESGSFYIFRLRLYQGTSCAVGSESHGLVNESGSPDPTHNFERNYSRSRLDSVGHKVSKHHFNAAKVTFVPITEFAIKSLNALAFYMSPF